jgi:hypothetical protein
VRRRVPAARRDLEHIEKVVKPIPPRDLQGTLCARLLKELLSTNLAESQS